VNVRLDQPAMLLLALPCLALALASWRWLGGSMDPVRRGAVIGLRTAVLLALVVVLAGPRRVREHHYLAVIGVLDISGSVRRLARFPEVPGHDIGSSIEYLRHWFREATRTRAPDDRFGLVVFDGSATVVSVPGRGPYVDDNLDLGAADGTNIAEGIRMALATFPADAARRIVLVSDGNETSGSAVEAARQAAAGFLASGPGLAPRLAVPIDIVPLDYRAAGDVRVVRLEAPPLAQPGQTVALRIVLEATAPASGTLELRREGRAIDLDGAAPGTSRRITVPAGRSVQLAQVVLDESPVNRFQAAFEADDPAADALPVNNRAEAFTATPGRGAALVVDAAGEGSGNALAEALARAGIPVTVEPPHTVGSDLLSLHRFDLVVLDNVAAYELGAEQQALLARYVHDLGGGLIMVGGEQGFGAGGWNGTELEKVLPVELDPPKDLKLASAALVLVLDKSGSMNQPVAGTRASQQRIANEAAALAIESLRPESLVGVVSFDFFAHVEVELQRNDDPKQIAARVRSIAAEGGTNLAPALREAHRMLRDSDAQRKLVVVLSDGRSQSGKLDEIVEAMADSNIRLTTIAVGDEADQETLERLAAKGGGEFYPVRNPRTLPRVLVDSVQVINKPLLKEVTFRPAPGPTGGALAAALRDAPELDGLVITTARPDPGAVVEATDPEGEPLLAHWQVGLGRVAAFTSDAAGRWSARWLEWPGFEAFWAQLARTIGRPAFSADAELFTAIEEGQLRITLEASGAEGFLDYLQVDGVVYAPGGAAVPVTLRQVAPGRYQASVPAHDPGNYVVALGPRRGSRRLSPVIGGISQPESPEFRADRADPALLEHVRQVTGGRTLDIANPGSADLFDRRLVPPARSSMPAWGDLLWLALGLLLLDVAARRIAWDSGLLRRSLAAAARLAPRRGPAGAATALASLRRAAPRERPAPPRRADATAPRPAPARREEVAAALDALLGRREGTDAPRAADATEPPAPEPETPESATAGLLAAKRRARSLRKKE
jgi:Mg-chelatase subunit ChlD